MLPHVEHLVLVKYQLPIQFGIRVKFTLKLKIIQKSYGSHVGDVSSSLLLFIMLDRFFFYIAMEQKYHFLLVLKEIHIL